MAPSNRELPPTTATTDSTHTTDAHQVNDASSVFLTQLQNDRAAKTAEQTRDVSKPHELLSTVKPGETALYPNQLIAEAQSAGKEIATLLQSGQKPTDVIHTKDAQGRTVETTVGDRIESLRTLMNDDCKTAIVASNELIKKNPNLDTDYNNTTARLQTAAQQAGLDYNSPNFAQQAAQRPELADLAKQQELLQAARMAPGTAMLTYAMLKAEGLTEDPAKSLESFKTTGMPKPSKEELTDAFMLVSQAGRTNSETFNSPMYASVNTAIKADYAQTQSEKGSQIVTMLKDADKLSQSGSSAQAEAKYQEAWKLGETIDQKFLAAQLKLPANQNNPEVQQALVGIIADVKEARMHYANFLVKEGKYSDALPIALSVGADTPQFAQQDAGFNKLVSDATFGKSMPQGELQAHQAEFARLMQDTKDPDRFTKAQKELDTLVKNFQDTKTQLEDGKPKLEATKKELDGKLADLEKNKDKTDKEEYNIEKLRLENEKKVIETVEGQNDKFLKQESYLKYMQGTLKYSQDDKDGAHALFEEVKKTDPELAANKDLKLDELLDATKHQNWFQRNWQSIATGLAVVAGVAVGVLLSPTGPVAVGAGIGTTAAICAAIGGGALAGAAVYSGTKGIALGFDKVTWRDAGQGALLGASGALPVSGLFGAGAAASEATVAASTGEAASTSAFANMGGRAVSMLGKVGISGRSLAAGGVLTAGNEGMQVAFDGKSWGDAAKDFAWRAPLAATGIGIAGNASGAARLGWIAATNGAGPAVEIGAKTYAQINEHVLDPSNAKENDAIWQRYDGLNPSLYRPETAPAPTGDQQTATPAPRKQLSQDEIDKLRNQDITDEPVK